MNYPLALVQRLSARSLVNSKEDSYRVDKDIRVGEGGHFYLEAGGR